MAEVRLGCSTWSRAVPAKAYADWLSARGDTFTGGITTATLDPFRGYANAIRDELEDATAVLDAFHVVKLGLHAMEETRRRAQQDLLGHRGRKDDPLYKIRTALRAGADKLTSRQIERIEAGLQAGDPTFEVTVAWRCYQQLRSAFQTTTLAEGKRIARAVLESFPSCPIPRSPASAGRYGPGGSSSWPTSPPAAPTTAAPRPSTASSNSTAASPAASATQPTTDSG